MKNHNHYELAFESYIQQLGLPCVATRERRRSLMAENLEAPLKNFDFILSSKQILAPSSWSASGEDDYASFFRSTPSFFQQGFSAPSFSDLARQDSAENSGRSGNGPSRNVGPSDTQKIILPPSTLSWLVDIKGRRFPSGQKNPQYWRNWVSSDDLVSLTRWENIFGAGFHGLFVFVYDVCGERLPLPENRLFQMNDKKYAFFILPLAIYRDHCHQLSSRWETSAMPGPLFRKYVVPLDDFFGYAKFA